MVTPISSYETNALVPREVSSERTPGNGETGEVPNPASESLQSLRKVADPAGSRGDGIRSLEQAAEEFESLLIAQILRGFREAGSGGWTGFGGPAAPNPAMDLAESQLARILGQHGALGLVKTLQHGLLKAGSRTTAAQDIPEPAVARSISSHPPTGTTAQQRDGP